jgi:hypothetical protein
MVGGGHAFLAGERFFFRALCRGNHLLRVVVELGLGPFPQRHVHRLIQAVARIIVGMARAIAVGGERR